MDIGSAIGAITGKAKSGGKAAYFRERGVLAIAPARLLTGLAIAILLCIWGGIAYEIRKDRADSLEEWNTNLTNLTRAYSEHILRAVSAADQDMIFARNLYLREGPSTDLIGLKNQGALTDEAYRQVGIIGPDGRYLASSSPHFKGVITNNKTELWEHRDHPGDNLIISQPFVGHTSPRPIVHLTRRITLPGGTFGGIVIVSLSPSYLGMNYSDVKLGPDAFLTVAGNDGIVRGRHRENRFTHSEDLSKTALFTRFRNDAAGTYTSTSPIDNIERLITFRRLVGYPLVVSIGVPTSRVYERSDERRESLFVLGSIATLCDLLFTAWLMRMFKRQEETVEKLTEARMQAEAANTAKSEFLASMSHELRTPLNGILGFAEIIARKSQEEKIRRQAGIIHSSGSHLLTLLNSILDLAKVESGKMELHLADVNLRRLIEEIGQLHQVTANNKKLAFALEISDDFPALTRCDPTLVRQVLNNLVNNAIKFTPEGGISLSAEMDGPDLARLTVIDSGIGIDNKDAALIFEKFRQADQSATRAHQGTGLGLSLAKQLVELMGGQITLVSALGEGTSISFTLPLIKPALKIVSNNDQAARLPAQAA